MHWARPYPLEQLQYAPIHVLDLVSRGGCLLLHCWTATALARGLQAAAGQHTGERTRRRTGAGVRQLACRPLGLPWGRCSGEQAWGLMGVCCLPALGPVPSSGGSRVGGNTFLRSMSSFSSLRHLWAL